MFRISLFSLLTFITFIDAFKGRLISMVLKLIPENPLIKSTAADIIILEKELGTISMVNEFAKHVKLQRRITKIKENRKELVKKQAFKVMKIRYSLMAASYILILGSLVTLVWIHRSEPVAQVPPHWLWPISTYFDWYNYIPGCISVPCWVAISSSATKTFAKYF